MVFPLIARRHVQALEIVLRISIFNFSSEQPAEANRQALRRRSAWRVTPGLEILSASVSEGIFSQFAVFYLSSRKEKRKRHCSELCVCIIFQISPDADKWVVNSSVSRVGVGLE